MLTADGSSSTAPSSLSLSSVCTLLPGPANHEKYLTMSSARQRRIMLDPDDDNEQVGIFKVDPCAAVALVAQTPRHHSSSVSAAAFVCVASFEC